MASKESGAHIRLKNLRTESKLGQKEFAARLGIAKSYWSALERGSRELTGNIIRKLMIEFGVSSDWLLTGSKSFNEHSNQQLDTMLLNIIWLIELIESTFGNNPEHDKYLESLQAVVTKINSTKNKRDLDSTHTRLYSGLQADFFQIFSEFIINTKMGKRKRATLFNAPKHVIGEVW